MSFLFRRFGPVAALLFTFILCFMMGPRAVAASIEFKRPNEFTLTAKLSNSMHFVCEKIAPAEHTGIVDWQEYRDTLKTHIKRQESSLIAWGQEDALNTFQLMLTHFAYGAEYKGELWVAYLTDLPYEAFQEQRENGDHFPYEHVEMSMGLGVVDPTLYSPVGILRNPLYAGETHKKISISFHALSAMAMKTMYPHMQIMLTKPAQAMRIMLNDALEKCDPSLYIDQATAPSEMYWAMQIPSSPNHRLPYHNLKVVYNGQVLVETVDVTTRNNYDFLVAKMPTTAYYGVAVEALQHLFAEHQKFEKAIPFVEIPGY